MGAAAPGFKGWRDRACGGVARAEAVAGFPDLCAPPVGRPPPARMRAIAPHAGIRGQARSYDFVPLRPAHGFTRHPHATPLRPDFRAPLVGRPPPARMRAIAPRRHSRASPLLRFRSPAACPRFYATPPRDTAPPRFSRPPCGKAAPGPNVCDCAAPAFAGKPAPTISFPCSLSTVLRDIPTRHRSAPIFAPPLWEGCPRPECVRLRRAGIRGQARSYDFVPLRPVHGFTRHPHATPLRPDFRAPCGKAVPGPNACDCAARRHSRASPLLRFRSPAACHGFTRHPHATPPVGAGLPAMRHVANHRPIASRLAPIG
jgi:hypothetical protein